MSHLVCRTCGSAYESHTMTCSTMVSYGSPMGHDHDDNCLTRTYRCPQGHKDLLSVRRTCSTPGCTWKGKITCKGCGGDKIDAWPEDAPLAH